MNYQETIDYLYKHLPMFSRIGSAAYKADLHNTEALCSFLGNPHNKFKSVHIAGTNGKGSTSHMLAAILQHAGYKTGLYTSPHIHDFRERIRVNGEPVSEYFVTQFVQRTLDISKQLEPSFFELTVAMAFDYFATEQVDIAIIETGLGGKLDSTNVITPILSVITNIGFDHTAILGKTLPEIAVQKAGIIKKEVPVVIGETVAETREVFIEQANAQDAPIYFASEEFVTGYIDYTAGLLYCFHKNIKTGVVEKLRLDLSGLYQVNNSRTVLCCVEQLRKMGYNITDNKLLEALEQTRVLTGLRGRWDIVQNNPTIIYDVAHNAGGITQVLHQLKLYYPHAPLHFVIGFVKDKDVSALLELFPGYASYYFTNAHIPRALPHAELKAMASQKNLLGESFDDVNEAIYTAKSKAGKDDVIVVCGSFYIIAEVT